jgi:hypothetical protein
MGLMRSAHGVAYMENMRSAHNVAHVRHMQSAHHVTYVGHMRNAYTLYILVTELKGTRPLGRI